MHFGNSRHDFLGYTKVPTGGLMSPTKTTSWASRLQEDHDASSFYTRRPTFFWRKGNQINTVGDSLAIKIGGDPNIKNKKKKSKNNNRIKSTKYTIFTFLPQNLLEQFRRIANFYFLVMSVVSLVIDSPVSPLTSISPLVFVIAVTAAKQGYEDYLRHRTDNMVNYSLVTVLRNGTEIDIKCQDIIQGDLVKATRDCDVPCDLVLLKTSDKQGKCHITTANLDGETNLKTLQIPKGLPHLEADKLHTLGTIECEQPRTDLYTFMGKIELANAHRITSNYLDDHHHDNEQYHILPLMADNLLLRGSRIKNTEWAIGCAVYTGQSTKLALNSRLTRIKVSSSEKHINKFLIFILFLLLCIVTFCYFLKRYNDMFVVEHNIYLGPGKKEFSMGNFLQDYLSFLILFNYLIPISLYVTIEMHKFFGSFFLEWDPELYDEDMDQPCIVNTSDLNEELGQVNILFSDKTGTLTKNEMLLQQCSIEGRKYVYKGTSLEEEGNPFPLKIDKFNEYQFVFFQALTICHTVQVAGTQEQNDVPEELIPKSSESIQNLYTDNNVKGEIDNNYRIESDYDEPDFIPVVNNSISHHNNHIDNNPLLIKNKFDKPITFKKTDNVQNLKSSDGSLNKIFITNKIYPKPMKNIPESPVSKEGSRTLSSSASSDPFSYLPPLPATTLFQRTPNGRPFSLELNRSNSHIEQLVGSNEKERYQTHRRTQSYGTPQKYQSGNYGTAKRSSTMLRRSGSAISNRESYAAAFFTTESLLQRMESTRRKDDIKTVVDTLDYQASSPDEKSLVEACATLGFIYINDDNDVIKVQLCPPQVSPVTANHSTKMNFKRLHILEFTSDRKRMSVIVRDKKGDVWIYTKGAESHVLPLCNSTTKELINKTNDHITDFSRLGLRTLAVARRKLSEIEYWEFHNELMKANNSLNNRQKLLEDCHVKVERNLELLGATAVEDALQDNVRNTLESLEEAGIKIWVLTGDKVETALNIALSCGQIPERAQKYFITECNHSSVIKEHLTILEYEIKHNPYAAFALLIDGRSLQTALKEHSIQFRNVSVKCSAVLCCRLSPLQKCEVVQLIKTAPEKYITAAIGDGANDVSMIQEAHVGLGIVGKEGRQAARCADYALANFSMIKRMFLVHGHYYTNRIALLVLYFFYKNIVFMGIQLYYQFDTMFSTQSVYDSLFLTCYNVVYTALPILFISLTEKPYPEETLMTKPELYKNNTQNRRMKWKYFIGWTMLALYHSLVLYLFSYQIWSTNNAIYPTPYVADYSSFGTFLIHNVVVIVNMKLWLEATYQSYVFIGLLWFSILGFMITTVLYNILDLRYDADMLWVYNNLLSSVTFWLLSLLLIVTSLLPDFVHKTWINTLNVRHIKGIIPRNKRNQDDSTTADVTPMESTYL